MSRLFCDVILNGVKDLSETREILRFAQNDNAEAAP
ncbi:MAG: hypothetical protein QOK27_2071 [Gemmatimonadales bacterium]|jgi:hypothetical protein|nr:hypothetical protein [Gemmatimonadales bacterium]